MDSEAKAGRSWLWTRRDLLCTAGATLAAGIAGAGLSGCGAAAVRADGTIEDVPIDAYLSKGCRTMWIAAHPDDECFAGTLLARSRLHWKNPLHFLVMTHGDGGECCLPEGCRPDLATVRAGEMKQAVALYRASLQHERYWNAPLPVESFPKRHEIFAKWQAQGDPVALVTASIRRFKPDLVLTFDPDFGGTGHPEHQLTSRIALTAVRRAADAGVVAEGLAPHRTGRSYCILNRFWLLRLAGGADPGPVTEVFDATLPALPGQSCAEFMCEATRVHRTQDADMGLVRRLRGAFLTLSLRQVDPFRDAFDAAQPPA